MKRGLFSVPPNLIIHTIIVIAALALMVLLISTFLETPEYSDVENELENFANFINAFDESDRTSDNIIVMNAGDALFVMFDGEDRQVIWGKPVLGGNPKACDRQITGESINCGGITLEGTVLKNTCSQQCVCAYVPGKMSGGKISRPLIRVSCEDVNKNIILDRNKALLPNSYELNEERGPDGYLLFLGRPAYGGGGLSQDEIAESFKGESFRMQKIDKYILLTQKNYYSNDKFAK